MGSKNGFTLVEILISVALTGLVASMAFAPVAYVVRQVTETETAYSDETALRRAAMFMAQDVAQALRLADVPLRVVGSDEFGSGDDNALIVASSAQAKQNMAAGSIAYRVVRRSLFTDGSQVPGLYRWLLPGILPVSVDHARLETEDGHLVVPNVSELSLSVFDPPEWVSEYSGGLPQGMKIIISRERADAANREDEKESVEYVFALPR